MLFVERVTIDGLRLVAIQFAKTCPCNRRHPARHSVVEILMKPVQITNGDPFQTRLVTGKFGRLCGLSSESFPPVSHCWAEWVTVSWTMLALNAKMLDFT